MKISNNIPITEYEDIINVFTKNLRKNYKLLMNSPMPLNRKLFVTLASINYKCIELPYSVIRRIKR